MTMSVMLEIFVVAVLVVLGIAVVIFRKSQHKKDVKGQLALVTGGGNGLGQQISFKLAKLGCHIAIADIDITSAEKTAEAIKQMGVKSKAYKVDVSSYSEIENLKRNIEADFGTVDLLVNNAGIIPYKTIFDQTADELELLTKVNFNSVMLMTKCFLPSMIDSGKGHIVTISSLQGIYAYPFSAAYCATKFGVTGFMLSLIEYLRLEKLIDKINITIILPSVIATRKDIIEIVNTKFELLKPDHVADKIIDAILKNRFFVSVPEELSFGISLFNVLPFCIQHFIRDYLRQESTFLVKSPN